MDLFSTAAARARTASDTTSEAAAMPRGKQREKVEEKERGSAKFAEGEFSITPYFTRGW